MRQDKQDKRGEPLAGPRATPRKNPESGYALLLVFLMAAMIAISLYSEIPRVAFQSQRHKEQLLVERGEQYKRAIQVFMRNNNNQWPRSLEDLETFQTRHFLRHKYVDPMTGKAEWRVIHIQNGMLTDSVFSKKQGDKKDAPAESNYISALPGVGQTPAGAQGGASAINRRRANEGGAGTPGFGQEQPPQIAGSAVPGAPGAPGAPAYPAGQPGQATPGTVYMPGQQPMPGTVYPGGRQPMPGMPGMPGTQGAAAGQQPAGGGSAPYISAYPGLGSQPTTPTTSQPIPGMPGTQGVPLPGVPPGVVINPQTGQPVQAGPSAFPGASPGGQNPATQMIQNILTNPNPRGMATVQGQQQGAGSAGGVGFGSGGGVVTGAGGAGGTIGGGVAGVASGAEMEGIMVYNDRTAYNEWEFVFDPSKIPPMPRLGGSSMGGTPANQMGTPAGQLGQQQQQQTTAFGQPSPFGQPAGGAGASRGGIMPGAQQGGVQPGQQGGMQPGGFGMGQGGQIQIRMGRP